MKTGCFIKSLIVATIVIASITYIVTNKFDDWVKKPIQDFAFNIALEEFNEEIETIPNSQNKETLIKMVESFVEDLRKVDKINMNNLDKVGKMLNNVISDSDISMDELNEIKSTMEEFLKNEK